jgi:hypothetical protein
MRILRLAAGMLLLALAVFCLPLAGAFAQTVAEKTVDTTIEIPIGEWLTAVGDFVLLAIPVAFAWLARKLPGQAANILITLRVDQLLQKAVQYGINATAGAMKDKPLSVDVGSEVLENALQYVVDNGPGWLIKWMGGKDTIRQKIIARLELDEAASVDPRNPGFLN